MHLQLTGTAFDASEAGTTQLTVDGQRRPMPQQRGLNTVILHPNGLAKTTASHDVYGNAVLWHVWADWLKAVAAPEDVVAVASYDAVSNAPRASEAGKLLQSIGAAAAYGMVNGDNWRHKRVSYALLFVYGDDSCRELATHLGGPLAHLNAYISQLTLKGTAFDSPDGNETSLLLNEEAQPMPRQRGLNSLILGSDNHVSVSASHDVFDDADHWHAWADWVRTHAVTGDTVAVASYDAVRNAPASGAAADLLREIGATKAFGLERGKNWRSARVPYALLFTYGEHDCREVATKHKGRRALIRTALLTSADPTVTRSRRPVLYFDGNSNYLSSTINVSETAFTVSLWFKTTDANCGLFCVDVGERGRGGHDRHLYLDNGSLCARLWSNETIRTDEANYADGRWHRLTYTFGEGSDGQRIYLDGELKAKGNKNHSDLGQQDGINIGFSNDADRQYFRGEIAEVSVWSVVRSERDIRTWRERVVGNESGLQALYSFGEGRGKRVTDYTPGKAHATLHGPVSWRRTEDFPGEYLLSIVPEDLELISEEAATLATAGTSLGRIVATEPREPIPPRALSDLIAEGDLQHFALLERLRAAITNDELELTEALLRQFAGIGEAAADVFEVFATIEEPKVQLITGKPGMVGAPGMEVVGDPETSSVLATPEDHSVRVTGRTTLFGRFPHLVSLDFFHYRGKPGASFKLANTKSLGIGTMLPGVPLIQALMVKTPTIVVTSVSSLYDPTLDSGIEEGFNFFGNMDIGASPDKAMRFIGGVLAVEELAIHLAVSRKNLSQKIVVEGAVRRNVTLVEGDAFRLAYTRSDVGIELSGLPMEPSVSMSNYLVVSLRKDGEETHLVFTGGNKFELESVSGFFTMNGTGRHPEGALTGAVQNTGTWEEPFGIPGITLRQMSVQLGFTYAPPWVDNIGIHGNLQVGTIDGSASILVDANDPDQFVLAGATERITMLEIMSFMSPVTFVAYQATPAKLRKVMNKVIDVKLEDAKLSIVPNATSIGGVHFRDEGVTFAGKLTAWGWKASAFINVDTFDGITVRMDMDPVDVHGMFKITGADGDPAPAIRLRVNPGATPYVFGTGKIYLLGLSREMRLEAGKDGMTFMFRERWGSLLETNLSCSYADYNLRASGSIDFNLNVTIPTKLGDLTLVDIGFGAATELRAGKLDGFYLSLDGHFRFYGKQLTLPKLELAVAPSTFKALYEEVIKTLKDEATELFLPVFKTLEEWASAVAEGTIKFAGEVAKVAKEVYGATKEAAIKAYKIIGQSARRVAAGLKTVYNATAEVVLNYLKKANYSLRQITLALKDAYDYTAEAIAAALKDARYKIKQIASVLKSAYGVTRNELAAALKHAKYSAKLVADRIKSMFSDSSAVNTAKALKHARYAIKEVAKAVKKTFNINNKELAKALRGADYTAQQIGNVLKDAFRLSAKGVGEALKHAEFGVKTVGKVLKETFNLAPKALNTALKGAGYAANEIKDFFSDLGGDFADFMGGLLGAINPFD